VSSSLLYWLATASLIVIVVVAIIEDWLKLGEWH
jgi:hypothetical protein